MTVKCITTLTSDLIIFVFVRYSNTLIYERSQ